MEYVINSYDVSIDLHSRCVVVLTTYICKNPHDENYFLNNTRLYHDLRRLYILSLVLLTPNKLNNPYVQSVALKELSVVTFGELHDVELSEPSDVELSELSVSTFTLASFIIFKYGTLLIF